MEMKWISVHERLPENKEQVIVWNEAVYGGKGEAEVACYEVAQGFVAFAGNCTLTDCVKYWMPLPKFLKDRRTNLYDRRK